MQYILGTICLEEAKDVLNYEGEEAFGKSFEYLGEVAMMSLIDETNVKRALENWIIHLDPNFIKKFDWLSLIESNKYEKSPKKI